MDFRLTLPRAAGALTLAVLVGAMLVAGAAGVAGAATPLASLEVREIAVAGQRGLAVAQAVAPFSLVGLHWQGSGTVSFRTRNGGGGWSAWQDAAPEAEDTPDAGSPEAVVGRGWRLGNPYWVGVATRLEVRTRGAVGRVKAYYVRSGLAGGAGTRALAAATPRAATTTGTTTAGATTGAATTTGVATITSTTAVAPATTTAALPAAYTASPRAVPPAMLSRTQWGANVFISKPSLYAAAVRFAVIHHTAGVNAYAAADSAAIVRGIQLYHVQGNGWNDVGYNFVVDKYGQIFEGRNGGIDRAVIGAHAVGFNAGSVGIAVIGSYGKAGISSAAQEAIKRLLGWRLDVAHVDPLSTLSWSSGGNPRYPRGIPVFLRAVSGHRDTGFTDCPGDALYRSLDGLSASIAATGLAKIYAPGVDGALGGPVRFTARLSGYGKWRITLSDAAGKVVARAGGAGIDVDWTWDASKLPLTSTYRWLLESGSALPATGTVGKKPTPLPPPPGTATGTPGGTSSAPGGFLSGLTLSTVTLTPNGDGANDSATVSYTLTAAAFVSAFVLDQSGTVVAQTLFTDQKQSARPLAFTWDPSALADGRYRFVVSARLATGEQSTAGLDVLVVRTLALLTATPAVISPNGDGVQDATTISFILAKPGLVTLRLLAADGSTQAQPFSGQLQAGPQQVTWDGNGPAGRLPDGSYVAQITADDGSGAIVQQAQVIVDSVAPTLALVSGPQLRFSLTESAAVTVIVDGKQTTQVAGPGEFQLPLPAVPPTQVSAVAVDAAGNSSSTISWP